ncbi:hypothetical protein J6590_001087 [Homalodisca vitripennis]|nr:hypothetical protein J6590_001087 [Homalodisca vitripennis]
MCFVGFVKSVAGTNKHGNGNRLFHIFVIKATVTKVTVSRNARLKVMRDVPMKKSFGHNRARAASYLSKPRFSTAVGRPTCFTCPGRDVTAG